MAARLLKVAPTKNNLLSLRRQLGLLEQGHELLERKRELLTRLVYARIAGYRKSRAEARKAIAESWRWLGMAQMRMGAHALQQAALGTGKALQISILPRSALGVQYPSMSVQRLPLNPVGLLGTDASFDEARRSLAETAYALARLSESRVALSRLLGEQRKAQKRVNALQYNIIPRYRESIRYIQSVLEEEERNRLFQIKLLARRGQRQALLD